MPGFPCCCTDPCPPCQAGWEGSVWTINWGTLIENEWDTGGCASEPGCSYSWGSASTGGDSTMDYCPNAGLGAADFPTASYGGIDCVAECFFSKSHWVRASIQFIEISGAWYLRVTFTNTETEGVDSTENHTWTVSFEDQDCCNVNLSLGGPDSSWYLTGTDDTRATFLSRAAFVHDLATMNITSTCGS